jgi:hypothetical protein
MKLLRSKRGEMLVTVSVVLMVAMTVVAFSTKLYPVFLHKQQLDTYAGELCRVAEISGRVGDETVAKEEKLDAEMKISPNVAWNTSGKVQLNGEITVTCTITENIGLWGGFGSFPITIQGRATGQSEVYWK